MKKQNVNYQQIEQLKKLKNEVIKNKMLFSKEISSYNEQEKEILVNQVADWIHTGASTASETTEYLFLYLQLNKSIHKDKDLDSGFSYQKRYSER